MQAMQLVCVRDERPARYCGQLRGAQAVAEVHMRVERVVRADAAKHNAERGKWT